jgi:hypothetical protein
MPRKCQIVSRPLADLKPYKANARTHSKRQVRQIADSIKAFGFNNPVLVNSEKQIIAGHGRVAAAALLGLKEVPTLELAHLSPEECRAYILADNKLAQNAGWDSELLALELQGLIDLDFDVGLTGFSLGEIELVLEDAREASTDETPAEDVMPPSGDVPVSKPGDLWQLGRHKLFCGDARERSAYSALLVDEQAGVVFTDPPYNVPIDGHVCGLGRIRHREFAMGCGEMSRPEFVAFLKSTLGNAAEWCRDGAIAYVCMDWRHMGELLEAGGAVFDELSSPVTESPFRDAWGRRGQA